MQKNQCFSQRLISLSMALLCLVSSATFAHTSLKTSVPANGQTVADVQHISVEFGAALQLMALVLKDATGNVIPTSFARTATASAIFDAKIKAPLAPAHYQVHWMAMGADGHKIDGDFSFAVDPNMPSTAPSTKPSPKPSTAPPAQAVVKAALFSGLEQAPAKTVLAFHQALKEGDHAKVDQVLADDVMIFEGGGVERSKAEYAQHHMSADMAYLKEMSVETLEHHVKVDGNVAVSMARSKVNGSYKGKTVAHEGMETITLLKQNGQWRINHIHWSN